MAAAIGVRADYTSGELRRFARRFGDADQVRRLLAVALILDGGSRSEAAKMAGVTLLIVRDWVLRLNAGGPDGLATRKAPGRASILNDAQRARLAEIVETGPIPAANGVVRWRLCDLAQWIDTTTKSDRTARSGISPRSCWQTQPVQPAHRIWERRKTPDPSGPRLGGSAERARLYL